MKTKEFLIKKTYQYTTIQVVSATSPEEAVELSLADRGIRQGLEWMDEPSKTEVISEIEPRGTYVIDDLGITDYSHC